MDPCSAAAVRTVVRLYQDWERERECAWSDSVGAASAVMKISAVDTLTLAAALGFRNRIFALCRLLDGLACCERLCSAPRGAQPSTSI